METYDAIKTVLTVREYKQDLVPKQVIVRILNAARLTASAKNKQPWSFIVINDRTVLKQIADLASTGRHIANAAFGVAVITDPDNRYGTTDAARAIQSMTIEAWDEGLGSGWVGNIDREKVKELLSVPENLNLLTVIPFGYPTVRYSGRKRRKSFAEVVFLEKFGLPFEAAI